jgi:hypothetical protein
MSLVLSGSTSGSVTLQEPAISGTTVLDLPATSGNVVVDSATQTLTNKTIEGGTVISGTAVASTSGTSIDFTSIPSWVKRVTVMFSGVSTNGSSNYLMQLGTGGSVTTSGYVSASGRVYSGTNVNTSTAGFILGWDAAAFASQGSISFSNLSGNIWVASGTVSSTASTPLAILVGGTVTLSGVLDRVRITTVNGTDTFDAGSINILYE